MTGRSASPHSVKTAVSLPADVFQRAESKAKKLGISRSRLYAQAIADYLHRLESREIEEALNRVYDDSYDDSEDRELLRHSRKMIARQLHQQQE